MHRECTQQTHTTSIQPHAHNIYFTRPFRNGCLVYDGHAVASATPVRVPTVSGVLKMYVHAAVALLQFGFGRCKKTVALRKATAHREIKGLGGGISRGLENVCW